MISSISYNVVSRETGAVHTPDVSGITMHDIAVTAGIIGGAIALPLIAGGGIGIAMMGSAFGISAETIAIGGAIAGGVAGHKLTKEAPSEEITSEDEYSNNEADIQWLRNGDF